MYLFLEMLRKTVFLRDVKNNSMNSFPMQIGGGETTLEQFLFFGFL